MQVADGTFTSHVGTEQEGSLMDFSEGVNWNDDGYCGWETELYGFQLEVRPTSGDAAVIAPFRAQVRRLGKNSVGTFAESEEDAMNWAERQARYMLDPPRVINPYGPVSYIDTPANDHGQPCAQCGNLDSPTVANLYYFDTGTRENTMMSTCVECAPKVIEQNHDLRHGYAIIEVSEAPVILP